jgi:GAF domain-containing protein
MIMVAISVSALGFLSQFGFTNRTNFIVPNSSIIYWISIVINFLYIVFLISISLTDFLRSLIGIATTSIKKNLDLAEENKALTENLQKFEIASDRRKSRLVTTRQIARELSQQCNLDKLLHDSVDLIRSQLGYYHAAIFLTDERNENAILRAATGEAGRLMLERKHRLRIRDEGVVGYVIARGEPRTAFDVTQDSVHYKNPILPNTRSEMAVPLRVGNRIIGALDIQSDQIEAFSEEDIDVLQSIADQLSTTIDKTTQIQVLSQKVSNLEEGYRSYTRGVWQSHLKGSKKQLSYVYKQDTLGTDYEKSDIADNAILRGEAIISPAPSTEDAENVESELAVPITLRNQILGVLNIKCKGKTVPSEMVALINNASDRLALALENARLLEQIQERAEREHMVGEISTKVRTAVDIDSILRTTAAELGKSLSIDEVRIQLKSAE